MDEKEFQAEEDTELTKLAKKAYKAYGKATGGMNFRGEPMPQFDDLPYSIRCAWEAAVMAVTA